MFLRMFLKVIQTNFHSLVLLRRMNSILSLKHCCPMWKRLPTLGSTCRPARENTSRSMRSACLRKRSEPWRTNCSARSQRSSRSGHRGCWPNSARTSGRSSARILCSLSPGRSPLAVCSPTLTRRARWGESTACVRRTRCGAWTWSWWFYSKVFRLKVLTAKGWLSLRSARTRGCACSRIT